MIAKLMQAAALLTMFVLSLGAQDAHAGYLYKCIGPDGKSLTYTNNPCPSGSKQESLTSKGSLPSNEEVIARAKAEERAGTPCYAAKIGEYLPNKTRQGDPFMAPVKMNETVVRGRTSYQYVYEKYGRHQCYIYLDSDLKVTAIQR